MAVGDYDAMSIGFGELENKNRSCITSPLGIEAEIYKTWVYIRDEKAWQDGGMFVHPTVMEIRQGEILYKDLRIEIEKDEDHVIYCKIQYGYEHRKDKEPYGGIYGVGMYGEVENEHMDKLKKIYNIK